MTQRLLWESLATTNLDHHNLPELIKLVLNGKMTPGKVFNLTMALDQVANGYGAMDERCAIKTLLRPNATN